jgi:hypothetical protein
MFRTQTLQMPCTTKHSRNAVAAKARNRMAPSLRAERRRRVRIPRWRKRFTVQVRDHKIGDSLTLSLAELPWRGRFITSDHTQLHTRQICSAIAAILNHP